MNKTVGLVIGAVLITGTAFAGGYFLSGALGGSTAGPGGRGGGAFAQLSEDERAQMQNMTDEERQAFFEEKGIEMPAGGPDGQRASGGQGGPTGGTGGGTKLLEGVIASADAEKLTVTLAAGGSGSAYIDETTVIASVGGASTTVEKGANVMVVTVPEAAGVDAAKAVILR